MVTFQELIMISREFNEFTCLVTQHDHAQVSLDIFNMMNENLKSKSNNIPDLQYAIRNHDCGWIEYDLYPKLSDKNLIYTFQNMENHLQLELWLRSVSSSINPYSSLLISEHFKFLANQSKTLDITLKKDFIKKSDQLIRNMFRGHKIPSIETDSFKLELSILQCCDLISLVLCREKKLKSDLYPSIFIDSKTNFDYSMNFIEDSIVKFSGGFLERKENFLEVPYRQIETDLLSEPKKIKEEFKNSRVKFRRIYLVN